MLPVIAGNPPAEAAQPFSLTACWTRAGHGRASACHASGAGGNHAFEDHRQRPRHPDRCRLVPCFRGPVVAQGSNRRLAQLFLAGATLYTLTVAALGILLGTIASTMGQFALLAAPVLLVMQLLSGGATPMESMPIWLQYLMRTIQHDTAFRRLFASRFVSRS